MSNIRSDQLSQLMHTMHTVNISMPTKCLFTWQLLTITCPAEAAETRWDKVDFNISERKIPAARMKMNRDYTIPLFDGVLAILKMMKPLSGGREFIFPSRTKPNQPVNSQTAGAALKCAGLGGVLVSHGLRFITSMTLNGEGFPPDVIKAALAHVDRSEVRRARNRSDYLEQRRLIMQWWADLVEAADSGSTVLIHLSEIHLVG